MMITKYIRLLIYSTNKQQAAFHRSSDLQCAVYVAFLILHTLFFLQSEESLFSIETLAE